MVHELETIFVHAIPKDFLALFVGRKKVVVGADTLHHFLSDDVGEGFVFT